MNFTVVKKTWLAFGVIVGLGTVVMLVTYRGLQGVQREMRRLADVREPLKSATHEMEINVKGIAVGTLGYLGAPDPAFRNMVAIDEGDFERFHASYAALAATESEKAYAEAIGRLYEQFKTQSHELKAQRDRAARTFGEALARMEELDHLIDHRLQDALDPSDPRDFVKLEGLDRLEADVGEVGMWVADYRWSRREGGQAKIDENVEECREALRRLRGFTWDTEGQRQALEDVESIFELAVAEFRTVLDDEDEAQRDVTRFLNLRGEIDSLLDDQVQPLAVELLQRPRQEADAQTAAVVSTVKGLMPLFLVSAMLSALVLTRTVTRPLKTLVRGTEAVSRGDLAYRLARTGDDEFGALARAFNRMVARLQETLVSKKMLEKSERDLQRTVLALEQQMAEQIRAEEERIRLQASLRRAETLSAMGTLVAGVAHQVRNPLFGISSVLDAMEARLGPREEYQRYLKVLREQVDRVTALMHELMEYGRPGNVEPLVASMAGVVEDAVRACQARAQDARVTIVVRLDEALPEVIMDRPRLSRALENVLENAIQHSPASGTVVVTAKAVEDGGRTWLEIHVGDGGAGFSSSELPRVFEPFFTRRPGGTGLGLALVERIVQSHGGHVSAANREEGGAVVTVRLPVGVPLAALPSAGAGRGIANVE